MQVDITISIICHDNPSLLCKCLETVFGPGGDGVEKEVIVVLNTPACGGAKSLLEKFPDATFIENPAPLGFSANHNNALRNASGKYIAVLNDDIELHPGALAALIRFLENNPKAGAAGPRTLNTDGTVQESCYRLPTLAVLFYDAFFLSSLFPRNIAIGGYKRWPHDTPREVGHIVGACMIIPRETFEAAGRFDENFFLYYEEADLCKRIRDTGKQIWFVPGAAITHHGGASIGKLGPAQTAHFHESLAAYYRKHFGPASLHAVFALNATGAAARLALFALLSPFSKNIRARAEAKRSAYREILAWYLGNRPGGNNNI